MNRFVRSLAPMAAIVLLGSVGLACKNATARAEEATSLVRQMHKEIQEAQKKVIAKFKAMPEADDIRLNMEKNFDGWAVSEKCLSNEEESMDKALIQFQKDAKEEALIGELRLYAKKLAKKAQEAVPEMEGRIKDQEKAIQDGFFTYKSVKLSLDDKDKVIWNNRIKVFGLQAEFFKEKQRIAEAYEAKLSKLLK